MSRSGGQASSGSTQVVAAGSVLTGLWLIASEVFALRFSEVSTWLLLASCLTGLIGWRYVKRQKLETPQR